MYSISAQWRETVTRVPAPIVGVAPVLLQFSVANATSPWSVTVNGYTTNAAAGQTSVSVNIWDSTAVDWAIGVGAWNRRDQLMIQRTGSIPAAGGFTIAVIPVAVIYAPPQDSEKRSTATYAQGNTVGTSVTYDFNSRPHYQGQRPFLEQRRGLLHEVCARMPVQVAPLLLPTT